MSVVDTLLDPARYTYDDEFLAELCAGYDEQAAAADGLVDPSVLVEKLARRDASAAQALEQALAETGDPVGALAELRQLALDGLVERRDALSAAAEGDPAEEVAGEDQDVWNSFLAANGPRWDGTEQSWVPFREWFAYQAEQEGVAGLAESFLAYAEATTDKIATFAEYGIAITPAETAAAVPEDGFAEGDLAALFNEGEDDDEADAQLAAAVAEAVAENPALAQVDAAGLAALVDAAIAGESVEVPVAAL